MGFNGENGDLMMVQWGFYGDSTVKMVI